MFGRIKADCKDGNNRVTRKSSTPIHNINFLLLQHKVVSGRCSNNYYSLQIITSLE